MTNSLITRPRLGANDFGLSAAGNRLLQCAGVDHASPVARAFCVGLGHLLGVNGLSVFLQDLRESNVSLDEAVTAIHNRWALASNRVDGTRSRVAKAPRAARVKQAVPGPGTAGAQPVKRARVTKSSARPKPDGSWELPTSKAPSGLTPTDIEWADYAFNPLRAVLTSDVWVRKGMVVGAEEAGARYLKAGRIGWACVKKSEGCANCYSEALNIRWGTGLRFQSRYIADRLVRLEMDSQRIEAARAHRAGPGWRPKAPDGRPKVFVADMTDLFGESVPFDTLGPLFGLFENRPDVDWLLLTKRPERMAEYLAGRVLIPNVWVGTSIENQECADLRIPHLASCPAAVRFLSVEPLLGPVTFHDLAGIAWVITGGESGSGARPSEVDWFRSIRDQTAAASVAFFMKQLGSRPEVGGARIQLTVRGSRYRGKGGDSEVLPLDLRLRNWPLLPASIRNQSDPGVSRVRAL